MSSHLFSGINNAHAVAFDVAREHPWMLRAMAVAFPPAALAIHAVEAINLVRSVTSRGLSEVRQTLSNIDNDKQKNSRDNAIDRLGKASDALSERARNDARQRHTHHSH